MINSQCWLLVCAFQGFVFFVFLFVFFLFSFLAALSLCCCTHAFPLSVVVATRGYSLVVVLGFLIVVASLIGEHAL